MGRFSGLGEARSGGKRADYFLDGEYIVDIERVLAKVSDQDGDLFYIIEARVVESTNPQRLKGHLCAQVIRVTKIGKGNIKNFVGAALEIEDPNNYVPEDGQDKDEFWDEATELTVSDDQPLAGFRMSLHVRTGATKAGGQFTHHNWGEVLAKPEAA